MQDQKNVGGEKNKKTGIVARLCPSCGQEVIVSNQGTEAKLVLAGNLREEAPEHVEVLLPGQVLNLDVGNATEYYVSSGTVVNVPVAVAFVPGRGIAVVKAEIFVKESNKTITVVENAP